MVKALIDTVDRLGGVSRELQVDGATEVVVAFVAHALEDEVVRAHAPKSLRDDVFAAVEVLRALDVIASLPAGHRTKANIDQKLADDVQRVRGG